MEPRAPSGSSSRRSRPRQREVGAALARVVVGHDHGVVLAVDPHLPVERVRLQEDQVAAVVAVSLEQVVRRGLVVLGVAREDDRRVAPKRRERQPPELDVGHVLGADGARAEPARERQCRLVVVLDPAAEKRPTERDPALAPELVPAVGDPVQVGVVGAVGAPGEVGPDDERRVRLRPVERQRVPNDDRRLELVAGRIAGNRVVETGRRPQRNASCLRRMPLRRRRNPD